MLRKDQYRRLYWKAHLHRILKRGCKQRYQKAKNAPAKPYNGHKQLTLNRRRFPTVYCAVPRQKLAKSVQSRGLSWKNLQNSFADIHKSPMEKNYNIYCELVYKHAYCKSFVTFCTQQLFVRLPLNSFFVFRKFAFFLNLFLDAVIAFIKIFCSEIYRSMSLSAVSKLAIHVVSFMSIHTQTPSFKFSGLVEALFSLVLPVRIAKPALRYPKWHGLCGGTGYWSLSLTYNVLSVMLRPMDRNFF